MFPSVFSPTRTLNGSSILPTNGSGPGPVLASEGLLPPNNAEGAGAGFVTYTVEPFATATSGATVSASATVLFNNAAPQNTTPLTYTLDDIAPTTHATASQIGSSPA